MLAEVLRTARQGRGAARAKALDLLPSRYTAQLRDSLLDGLRDEAPEVREAVVGRLADNPGTAGVLPAALEAERDPNVARTVGRYVREHGGLPPGGDETVDLLTALTTDGSRRMRQAAADVLGAVGR